MNLLQGNDSKETLHFDGSETHSNMGVKMKKKKLIRELSPRQGKGFISYQTSEWGVTN